MNKLEMKVDEDVNNIFDFWRKANKQYHGDEKGLLGSLHGYIESLGYEHLGDIKLISFWECDEYILTLPNYLEDLDIIIERDYDIFETRYVPKEDLK